MSRFMSLSLVASIALLAAGNAMAATIINFDSPVGGSGGNGDKINTFSPNYGSSGNITVSYPSNGQLWNAGYGNLAALVLTPEFDTTNQSVIRLLATAFNQGVSLNGFDVAGFGANQTADYLRVIVDNVAVYNVPGFVFPNSGHADVDFGVPLVGTEIRIEFEGTGNAASLAIDNISYDQVALPEPSAVGVLLAAGAALLNGRRRIA
jgi:hypothetical protein